MTSFKRVGDLPAEFTTKPAATPSAAFKRVGDLPPEYAAPTVDAVDAAEMGAAGGGAELLSRSSAEAAADTQRASTFASGAARTLAAGATLGWGDEIVALGRSLYEKTLGSGRSYESLRDEERDALDAFKQQNPKLALTLELAGGFAMPGAGAARLVGNAATMGGRMARGAGIGAAAGAAAGAGANERGDDFIADTAKGAALGAAVGGAVPVATRVAEPLIETAGRFVPIVRDIVANRRAARELVDGIERDAQAVGSTAAAEIDRLGNVALMSRLHPSTAEGSLAMSVGDQAQAVGAKAAATSPRARHQVAQRIDDLDQARPVAREYDALYRMPDVGGQHAADIASLISSRPALGRAARIADEEVLNAGGRLGVQGSFSPQQIDQIDRALSDAINKAHRNGKANKAANLRAVREEFASIVDGALPQLREIQSRYALGSAQMRAAEGLTGGREVDVAAERTAAAFGAGVDLLRGAKASAIRWAVDAFGVGDERKAEAVTAMLLTRYRDAQAMTTVLDRLRSMAPEARRAQLDKLLAAGGAAAVASEREYRR